MRPTLRPLRPSCLALVACTPTPAPPSLARVEPVASPAAPPAAPVENLAVPATPIGRLIHIGLDGVDRLPTG